MPPSPRSLNELLSLRAQTQGAGPLYTFLDSSGDVAEQLTFAGLEARVRGVGERLAGRGLGGERVVLLFTPGLDFVVAFFACLAAGAVPVPAYPPRRNRNFLRLQAILEDSTPRLALTDAASREMIRGRFDELPELRPLPVLSLADLDPDDDTAWVPPPATPETLAFLQYTSGSTSSPRGVMVTHGNLLANERVLQDAWQDEGTVVSWLPLFHDMGLIGMVIRALYVGVHCVLMAPTTFLRRPVLWLRAVTRWRAGLTGAPDFAYNLCARKITEEERRELDLSSLNVAFNGAEPVRASTLDEFSHLFAPCGFRPEAFYPAYGLAEATLMASGGDPAAPPVIWEVDAAALEGHRAAGAADGAPSRRLVASGLEPPGHRLLIADPESHEALEDGAVGEIWLSGPSVAAGYWRRPDASRETFDAHLAGDPNTAFLRTGDLGFFRHGELFVTGRIKDLVIVRGRNHYPQDLEHTAEVSHPELRPGCSAAFTVEGDGEERLVLVGELQRNYRAEPEEVADQIRRAVAEVHEISIWDVVLIRVGTVPKTSSGKIQRSACRALYLDGELRVEGRRSFAGEATAPPTGSAGSAGSTPAEPAGEGVDELASFVGAALAELAGRPGAVVEPDLAMTAQGLDSLVAIELLSRVEDELGLVGDLEDLLDGATPREWARRLVGAGAGVPLPEPAPAGGDQPLHDGQRALWYLHRLDPEDTGYHLVMAARPLGIDIDVDRLRRAADALARRHPVLRTTYREVAGEPRARVGEASVIRVEERQVPGGGDDSTSGLAELAFRPFDLERGPLVRLILLGGGGQRLLVSLHHLAADLASFSALASELGDLYASDSTADSGAGTGAAPRYSLGDFARWQTELLAGPRGERLESYWLDRLAGAPASLRLPRDGQGASPRRAGRVRVPLAPVLETGLEGLARRRGATPFTVALAAFQALLHRTTGDDDLVVGAPVTLRRRPEWRPVAGFLVNTVLLRSRLEGNPSFARHVDQQRESVVGALAHGEYPQSRLAERLRPNGSGAPLFQAMLAWQQEGAGDPMGLAALAAGSAEVPVDLGCLRLEPLELPPADPQCELVLSMASGGFGLVGEIEYDRSRLDDATAERLAARFAHLLVAAVADPEAGLFDLPWLSAAERRQILGDWNPPPLALRHGEAAPLHDAFEARARAHPEAPALLTDDTRTYGELDADAADLARHLVPLGVGAEGRVALALPAGTELVVALLAVLKAGGAFVIIDPRLPAERAAFMLRDSGAELLIHGDSVDVGWASDACLLTGTPRALLQRVGAPLPASPPPAEGAAYLVYTSGSTGWPKGVVVSHAAAARHVGLAAEHHGLTASDHLLLTASFSFDVALEDLLAVLGSGGKVSLMGAELARPADLLRRVRSEGVTLLDLSPGYLGELLLAAGSEPGFGPLRRVLVGGDTLPPATARRWLRSAGTEVELVNAYGPTEAVITASTHRVEPPVGDSVPIGRPLAGRWIHVLDRGGEPAPLGVVGELVIGGPLLARGYAGRPAATAASFVPDAHAGVPGARLYRTGDRARRDGRGRLEHLGRLDRQVQVRGQRVEPAEVEAALRHHPGVEDAVVVPLDAADGPSGLAAYVVPQRASASREVALPDDLEAHLAGRLPAYMRPAALVPLAALPLNAAGKVDLEALPTARPARRDATARPATPTEVRVAEIWISVLTEAGAALEIDPGPADDFFALGGHSLSALRLLARLDEAFGATGLQLADLLRAPTLSAVAAHLDAAGATTADGAPDGSAAPVPLRAVERARPLPLTYAQERLWFLGQVDRQSARYHLPGRLHLGDSPAVPALAAALALVVERHEVLRSRVVEVDDEPRAHLDPVPSAGRLLPRVDLCGLSAERGGSEAEVVARRLARRPFDLAAEPPLRLCLLLRGSTGGGVDHDLLVTFHHVACDGWSLQLFLGELAEAYAAVQAQRAPRLPRLTVQVADYAVWQRRALDDDALRAGLEVWRRRLDGAPLLELPTDRRRTSRPVVRGGSVPFRLAAARVARLTVLARRTAATPFMVVLAAAQALLSRYTGQRDVVVGTALADRPFPELEPLIGFFVNTVAVRASVRPGEPFARLVERVRRRTLEAQSHRGVPFHRVVEALFGDGGWAGREAGRNPLFPVMVAFEQGVVAAGGDGVPRWPLRPVPTDTAKFELTLEVVVTGDGYDGRWEYAADLFDATTVERLAEHFDRLLAAVTARPEIDPWDVDLLSPAERRALLHEWNPAVGAPPAGPSADSPTGPSVGERFVAQAEGRPGAVALSWDGGEMSYGELLDRARDLATRLRRTGVAAEGRVALSMDRSPDLVVAILGVVLAGGAYVPLDPALPEERRDFILDELGAVAVVTGPGSSLDADGGGPIRLRALGDKAPRGTSVAPPPHPAQAAYVIYTSGSTGRPKGVVVDHANLSRLFTATAEWFDFGEDDVWTLFHSYAFDFSVWEMWGALVHGGRLVLVPYWVSRSPERFLALLRDEGVTVLNQTPSAFAPLVAADDGEADLALRWVIFGGEALDPGTLGPWFERRGDDRPRLVNMYGITETTVHVTYRPLDIVDALGDGGSVLGGPIPDLAVHLVDARGRLVPQGVHGEMWVAGDGAARGYLRRPGLTAERFVPDPFSDRPGARLYRSGDLARRLPDGDLEYLGRIDHQVKIRGHRIELGEIEAALRRLPGVDEAVVVDGPDPSGGRRLVAYVVGEGSPRALAGALGGWLPAYMVPAAWVSLDEIPLTVNGKVDRRSLPAPQAERAAGASRARTPVEELLTGVWEALLSRRGIGLEDDFFWLGGHSLLATRLVSRIRRTFGVEVGLPELFNASRLDRQAALVADRLGQAPAAGPRLGDAPPVPVGEPVPLSHAQRRLWFLHSLDPASAAYNMPGTLDLEGPLEPALLRAALARVVERQGSLRTRIEAPGGEPVQVVEARAAVALPRVDLAGLDPGPRDGEAARLARAEARRPFDLVTPPLFRATLLTLAPRRSTLVVVLHHLVADGWSVDVLLRDLAAGYAALSAPGAAGVDRPAEELPVQYVDYAAWQRRRLAAGAGRRQLDFWRRELSGAPRRLALPTDHPRPAEQDLAGGELQVRLDADLSEELRCLGRAHGATLFMTLLAAFQLLLARYSGQDDLIVGVPVALRDRAETEPLVGLLVNTLPLRGRLDGCDSFVDVLERARRTVLAAFVHRELPFESLVDAVAEERDLSYSPIFQVALAVGDQPPPRLRAGDVSLTPRGLDNGTAKFDLTLDLQASEDGIEGRMEYASALFETASVERLVGHFKTLLRAMVEAPESSPWSTPLLSPEERARALAVEPARSTPGDGSLAARFVVHTVRRPGAVAVTGDGRSLDYGELEAVSARLAWRLLARGVGPGTVVGVCLPPSPDLVSAVLAIHRAGAAYLPLDPAHPADRLRYCLEDSVAPLVLTSTDLAAGPLADLGVEAWPVDAPDDEAVATDAAAGAARLDLPPPTRDAPAYVIYTSGTTGRPKGTALTHRGLETLVEWHIEAYGVEPKDRASLVASPAFDASVWEIWPYLARGASLHAAPRDLLLDPDGLYAWMAGQGIDLAFLPTPLAEALLEVEPPPDLALRVLLVGGDRLHAAPSRELPFRLVNHYGPTEDSVVSTAGEVSVADGGRGAAPGIGAPIPGHQALVLDRAGQLTPWGVAGELWVAGAGLACGYPGRPGLTADRFRPHPWPAAPGERAYRTGDLAGRRPDGGLDFHGRADDQVQVRGFRIEVGEIEAALGRLSGVEAAAVVVPPDTAGTRLVAFVTGAAAATPQVLRTALAETLPAYMVPASIHRLERLPLTANGKLDRAALEARAGVRAAEGAAEGAAPRSDLERRLAALWGEVLGIDDVGVDDNFFALGGDSILSIKVVARARQAGLELSPQQLFQHPTVASLAHVVRVAGEGDPPPAAGSDAGAGPYPRVRIRRGQVEALERRREGRAPIEDLLPLTPLQQGMLYHVLDAPESGVYLHQQSYVLQGDLDAGRFAAAFRRVVARHQILRTAILAEAGDEPIQLVARDAEVPWSEHDWRDLPLEEQRRRTEDLFRAELERGFDLTREPLMRCAMVRLADDLFHFAWTIHLILLDGWSTPLVLDDVLTVYAALGRDESPELPPAVPWSAYADWLLRQDPAAAERYWRAELAGVTRATDVGGDGAAAKGAPAGTRGERTDVLDADLSQRLRDLAAERGLTLNTVFQGIWALYLARRSDDRDVVFGTVVSGRPPDLPGVETIVGLFLNTLPVRLRVEADVRLGDWLDGLQRHQAGARRYAYASQADLRSWSDVPSGEPLFESVLIFQNVPAGPSFDPGERWDVRVLDVSSVERNNFPLTVAVEPGDRLLLRVVYDADRFLGSTIARLLDTLRRLLGDTVEDPDRALGSFSTSSRDESRELIQGFNQDLEVL